jgi:trigger factor
VKLSVERLPESRVLLDIAADEDEFAKAMDRAYRRVASQVVIPGFRKGKAPRGVIERTYGREVVVEEAHKQLMTDLYRRVIEQESLVPVGDPEVEIVAAEPLAFKVTLPVYPTVDPGPYAETRIEPIDAAVAEADVDEVIERLRKQQSPWVDPAEEGLEVGPDLVLERKRRTPRSGDQVTIDYAVRDRESGEAFGEPVVDAVFVLGESNLLERMEEEIGRLRVGETAEFEVAFAPDDEAVDPDRRGKTLAYRVTLKGLKERELVPLDDDFARSVAEVDTLGELRNEIRDDLRQGKTADARAEAVGRIVEGMAATASIELPAPMVDEAVEEDLRAFRGQLAQRRASLEEYLRVNGQTEADLRAELRPAAAKRLRNSLLLREIARREGVAVDDAEVQAEVDRLVGAAAPAADPAQLAQFYGGDYFRGVLRSDLFERRVTDRLIEIATEGRGAVLNGWVEPEPEAEPTSLSDDASATTAAAAGEADGEDRESAPGSTGEAVPSATAGVADAPGGADALDRALTLATMSGQPGDLAEAASATVSADDLATAPDPAQAAAVGHDEENAAVAADAPADAITPEEREALGPPGEGGSLPNPTY